MDIFEAGTTNRLNAYPAESIQKNHRMDGSSSSMASSKFSQASTSLRTISYSSSTEFWIAIGSISDGLKQH